MKLLAIVALVFITGVNGRATTASSGSAAVGAGAAGTKSIKVKGEVFCGDAKASKLIVKLFNSLTDTVPSQLVNSDVNIGKGTFTLEGDTQGAVFDPVLAIYHNCDYDNKDKLRRVLIQIPSTYVTAGRMARHTYNIGKMNLEPVYPKETHENIASLENRFVRRLLKKMFF